MKPNPTIFCPFIISNDNGGGTKSTIALLNGLVERANEVVVLVPIDCQFVTKFNPKISIHFFNNYPDISLSKPFQFLKICFEMSKFVSQFNPQNTILLCSDRPGLMMMHLVKKSYTIFYVSRGWHYNSLSAFLIRKLIFPRVKRFICISDKQYGVIKEIVKNEDKIEVIYNGFDLPSKQFIPFVDDTKIVISTIGVICKRKAQLQCIELINKLKDNYPVVLHIYGTTLINEDVIYKKSLEKYISENGLDNYVFFKGHQSDIEQIYSSTDVVISSAIEEGFGRTLIESMAYGIPIIANSEAGGPKSIINSRFDGFLYDGTIHDLCKKTALVLDDKIMRNFIIKNASQTVVKKFSTKNMCDNYNQTIKNYFCTFNN